MKKTQLQNTFSSSDVTKLFSSLMLSYSQKHGGRFISIGTTALTVIKLSLSVFSVSGIIFALASGSPHSLVSPRKLVISGISAFLCCFYSNAVILFFKISFSFTILKKQTNL